MGFGPLCGILSTPILNFFIRKWGSEMCILLASIGFAVAFVSLGFIVKIEPGETTLYFTLAMLVQVLLGICGACLTIGEQYLLLRYSPKEEREYNLGYFRAASGIGGILAPILGAVVFTVCGLTGVFVFVAFGHLLIAPFIYIKMM